MHLALERAYARYAAACYGVFRGEPAKLAAALSVIPRRKERRSRRAAPSVVPASVPVATHPG